MAEELNHNGVYPSTKKILQSLENKDAFLYVEVREAWKGIVRKLGYLED